MRLLSKATRQKNANLKLKMHRRLPEQNLNEESNSAGGADTDLESSPEETGYQPHQYIIQAETSVGPDYVIRAVEGRPTST